MFFGDRYIPRERVTQFRDSMVSLQDVASCPLTPTRSMPRMSGGTSVALAFMKEALSTSRGGI